MKGNERLTDDSAALSHGGEAAFDLTVITVCYEARPVLPRVIRSVEPLLSSEAMRVEYLVIDGASDDGSADFLAQEQSAGRVTRFVSEPDGGLYDAMNKGIRMARGKVCVFINADDEIHADAVYACCEPILSGRAEMVAATARVVRREGKKSGAFIPQIRRYLFECPCCHQSFFCKTEVLLRIGGFVDADYKILADTDMMRRLLEAGYRCEVVDAVASSFYEGGVSGSSGVRLEYVRFVLSSLPGILRRGAEDQYYLIEGIKAIRRFLVRYFTYIDLALPPEQERDVDFFVRRIMENMPAPLRKSFRKRYTRQSRYCTVMAAILPPGKKKAAFEGRVKALSMIVPRL